MNINFLINSLNKKHNGTFFKIRYTSSVPLNAYGKKTNQIVTKTVETTVRKGINYNNLSRVKHEVIPNYTPENAKEYSQMQKEIHRELPWGKWKPNYYNLIIEHTNKQGEYNQYVRLYSSPNKPKIQYQLNGQDISTEKLKTLGIIGESYWCPTKKSDTYTINVANIEKIY